MRRDRHRGSHSLRRSFSVVVVVVVVDTVAFAAAGGTVGTKVSGCYPSLTRQGIAYLLRTTVLLLVVSIYMHYCTGLNSPAGHRLEEDIAGEGSRRAEVVLHRSIVD
jgi:hypothetical protein